MIRIILILITFLALFCGCASKGSYWPDRQRWQDSVVNAASHPGTWIPATGAVAIAAGGLDHEISDWARDEAPIFGSVENAREASDDFRLYARYGMVATTLLVHDQEEYWFPMVERMAWAHISSGLTSDITSRIKEKSARERPNERDKRSFPSGHTSSAFASAGMANRNIDLLPMKQGWKYTAQFVETSFGAATAWGRVEAGEHYPSDVLAGAALGNFIALLLHDAFLGRESNVRLQTDAQGNAVLIFQKKF